MIKCPNHFEKTNNFVAPNTGYLGPIYTEITSDSRVTYEQKFSVLSTIKADKNVGKIDQNVSIISFAMHNHSRVQEN